MTRGGTALNALRDALAGKDRGQAHQGPLRTAVVTQVSKAAVPWTVKVRLSEGVETGWLTMLGFYDPVVNDVVMLACDGPAMIVLGALAGQSKIVTTTATTTAAPTPAAPPAPPAAEPTTKTVSVSAVSSKTYQPPYGWRSGDTLYQGGGTAQTGLWFYGSRIATAKGAGTITAGTIYVQRTSGTSGVSGKANVRLGTHNYLTQPGGAPAALGNVAKVGALAHGDALRFKLTSAMIAALNAGADGFGLDPGALGYASADYLTATGRGSNAASGQLSLTITT